MTTASGQRSPTWTQLPGWLIRAPRLERFTVAIFTIATLTGLVLLVTQGSQPLNYLALAVTVAGAASAQRWRWRWVGICITAIGPVLTTLSPTPLTPSGVGSETILVWSLVVFTSFYWALRDTRAILLGLVTGIGSALAFVVASPQHWLDPLAAAALATTLAAAAAGSAISNQRRYLTEADHRRLDAQLTREAEIDRRIAQERVRIARDLHDMVGHQAAVVSMHLGAAELHLANDPVATARDLVAARAGVQGVLRETQRILEILRLNPGEDGVVPLADQTHLDALIDSFTRAGLPIEASLDQVPDDAAADVSAALYRTVQEALTNAQKHGTGTTRISLRIDGAQAELEVRNPVDPALPGPSRPGYGLIGMRERVTSAGGTLRESIQHGEFVLHVSLPLDAGPLR